MNNDYEQSVIRFAGAVPVLMKKGFTVVGFWLFKKNGVVYDLSAADLTKIDYIVENNLFVKEG